MFEQSKGAKELYLYTKKTPVTLGGVTLPGLFSTRYTTMYILLLVVVLILEVWGIYNLYAAGNFHYIFAVLLVALDILFAVLSHLPQKAITSIQNEIVLNDESLKAEQYKRRLSSAKIKQRFFLLLIALLALIKSIFFWGFYGQIDALMIAIVIAYIVVAFIHIRVTGYILFEFARSWTVRREYNRYVRAGKVWQLNPRRHSFSSAVDINEAKVNKHRLYANGQNAYILETLGLLSDDELIELINQQLNPDGKAVVARAGLHHQYYTILPAQPQPLQE